MESLLSSKFQYRLNDSDTAALYANQLLKNLGAKPNNKQDRVSDKATISAQGNNRWQQSGLANITGYPEQPLLDCPVAIAEYADGALDAFRILTNSKVLPDYTGADLLSLRSTMTDHRRQGNISLGGSCRIIPCSDGTVAVNLARESDWELLNAWLQAEVPLNWESVEHAVTLSPKAHLLNQGRLLGLAVTDAEPILPNERRWYERIYRAKTALTRKAAPRVVDLSSLWAGPLCGKLLQEAGAEVIKVEGSNRTDGARRGSTDFFQFLNDGRQEVSLDLKSDEGISSLRELICSADIVIEASRPRALRQMGIVAEDLVDSVAGLSWISITGYGRREPEENWIAYGDDAGVAGGLSHEIYKATEQWMFCGDAIADPLTGLHAALAGYASWLAGGGNLLSLSLVETVQHCVLTQNDMQTSSGH